MVRALTSVDANLDKIARLDRGDPTSINEDRRSDLDLMRDIEEALADPGLRARFVGEQTSGSVGACRGLCSS